MSRKDNKMAKKSAWYQLRFFRAEEGFHLWQDHGMEMSLLSI